VKKILPFFIAGAVVLAVVIFVADKNNKNISIQTPHIRLSASFYPLAEFSKQVGGKQIEVINIVQPGVASHHFEPTPQDMAKVYSSQIFVYNGGGFDPWAEKIAPELKRKGITVIKMAEQLNLLESPDGPTTSEGDPHFWLDPILAKKEVAIIRDVLIKADMENGSAFHRNAENYLAALSQLSEKYKDQLASCETREAISSHAAFGYLAKRYHLQMTHIAGISPEEEPTPRRMAEIAKFAREKNIQYIFFETEVPSELAEIIAREIGAETLVLNPLEGLTTQELTAGKNYMVVMEENLTHLRKALKCP
jgi:zinc transport system substrate-binding protein